MAGGVVPNEGLLQGATLLWGTPGPATEDFYVDLFTNNHTPVQTSVLTDFTLATFTGYARVEVDRSTFGSPSIVGTFAQITSSVSPAFTCSGGLGQTCYGFVMSGKSTGKLYFAQLFTSGVAVTNGVTLTLTPFTLEYESVN